MSRVVVLGGGFGGTAAAARLAKQGHDVTVVERRDRLGGAVGFVGHDGFRWDAGPTATLLPAVLRDLFRTSGRPLDRELDLVAVQPMREHRFADGSVLRLPSGGRAAQMEAVGDALGPGRGRQWVDYVHGFADTWDRLRRDYLEHPYSPDHVEEPTKALLRTRSTLHRLVARTFTDPRLVQLALSHAVADGQDPRRMPAWTGMWSYVEQSFGRWTVPGGMGLLAEAMARRLTERKVTVLTGTTARDLSVQRGRVVAVDTDHGPIEADAVVCAVDPRTFPALAGGRRRARPAAPPDVCHLGLSGPLPDLPSEVVLHGRPTLVLRTGGTAPPGGAAWTLLRRGGDGDPVTALARAGIDVREQVRVRVDRSATEQVEELGGSPYGLQWAGRATLARTLAPPPVRGVYVAGVHAAAGAGLAPTGLAAAVAAERIGPAGRARVTPAP